MKINFVQLLDFWGCGIEYLIGYYIHLGNKKNISLKLFLEMDYKNAPYESFLLLSSSLFSIFFMLILFFFSRNILYLVSLVILFIVILNFQFPFSILFLIVYLFYILYMHKHKELYQRIDISNILTGSCLRPILYLSYSLFVIMFSSVSLQLLLKVDFYGMRLFLFIFFNIIIFFAFIKKTSANVILTCMHMEEEFSYLNCIINRAFSIGTLCLSSLLAPIILIIYGSTYEEYVSYYFIIFNRSYFQSLRECKYLLNNSFNCKICKKIPKENSFLKKVTGIFPLYKYSKMNNCICNHSYIRCLLYPYITGVTLLTSRYNFFNYSFYENYHRSTTVFYLHAKVTEVIFTLSQAKKFVEKIENNT